MVFEAYLLEDTILVLSRGGAFAPYFKAPSHKLEQLLIYVDFVLKTHNLIQNVQYVFDYIMHWCYKYQVCLHSEVLYIAQQ